MPFLFHAIIFLSYASFAAVVAVVLPQNVPGMDPMLAMVTAGVVLIACGLLHEAFVRFEDRRELLGEVGGLRHLQDNLMDELARARGETRGLYEALEGA
jgi:hypothetical protein